VNVSEIGEFGLIDLISKTLGQPPPARSELILGIGDDAAAWQGDSLIQLGTVDSLVQDVHFSFPGTSWEDLGWKALAISLSDIAAMGGEPKYALVALSLPGTTDVADVISLYRGMAALAGRFDVAVSGGNISRAPIVVITTTVLGSTGSMLRRSAAVPGERVAVTGHLGAAAAGLGALAIGIKLDDETANQLKEAFMRPCPRVAEGRLLLELGVKTAIDISDGLVADLTHICEASQVGARIDVDQVPVHPAARAAFGDKALTLALAGGEDYELLFTAPAAAMARVKAAASCPVTVIGSITAGAGPVDPVDGRGRPVSLNKKGWAHF
jgi:thiamine-monophosphate kinase